MNLPERTPPSLSGQAQLLAKELPSNRPFRELLEFHRKQLAPNPPSYRQRDQRPLDRQSADWAYESGRHDGIREFIVALLGFDPNT